VRPAIAALLLLALAPAREAWAQSPPQPADGEAEEQFRRGKELMAAGKVAEACAAFDASQRLDPKTTTLLNQANCREKNGQLATAWELFREGVRRTEGAADKASQQMHASATERAGQLEPRLSTLLVAVPAGSRIAGLEILRDGQVLDPAIWDRALPIDGGSHAVVARAPGRVEWASTVAVAVERGAVVVEVPELRAVESAQTAQPGGAGTDVVARPPPPPESRGSGGLWSARRKLALGVGAGGAVALVVGGVLGVSAEGKQHDAQALCPDPRLGCNDADRANDLIRSGHDRAIGANAAFVVGGAAMIAAGVLWFTGAPADRRVAIAPAGAPGLLVVTASGRF
jgi:hypothetical protein